MGAYIARRVLLMIPTILGIMLISFVIVQFAPGEALIALRGRSMASCLAHLEQRLGRPLPAHFEADLRKAMAVEFGLRLQPMPGVRELDRKSVV